MSYDTAFVMRSEVGNHRRQGERRKIHRCKAEVETSKKRNFRHRNSKFDRQALEGKCEALEKLKYFYAYFQALHPLKLHEI
jgi:hypothetical protein